jgi:hypothetical protein
MTVQEFVSIDKDLQTVLDISDVNIIILIYLFIKHVLFILMYLHKCKMHVTMSVELKVYLFIWLHNFPFSMSLSLSSNSLYRQTTDRTEGGGLTREHCILKDKNVMARTRKYYLKNNYLTLRSKVKVTRR